MENLLYKITSIFVSNPTHEQVAHCFGLILIFSLLAIGPICFCTMRFLAERNILFRCKSEGVWLHVNVTSDPNNKICLDCNAKWKFLGEMPSQTETSCPIYKRIKETEMLG